MSALGNGLFRSDCGGEQAFDQSEVGSKDVVDDQESTKFLKPKVAFATPCVEDASCLMFQRTMSGATTECDESEDCLNFTRQYSMDSEFTSALSRKFSSMSDRTFSMTPKFMENSPTFMTETSGSASTCAGFSQDTVPSVINTVSLQSDLGRWAEQTTQENTPTFMTETIGSSQDTVPIVINTISLQSELGRWAEQATQGHCEPDFASSGLLRDINAALPPLESDLGRWAESAAKADCAVRLENDLEEVKRMYVAKHGTDLDGVAQNQDCVNDQDGTVWIVSVGHGAAEQKCAYDHKVSNLECKLDEVRTLYSRKYGRDLADLEDDKENFYDADGTAWNVTVGHGPDEQKKSYEKKVSLLECKLNDVKVLLCQEHDWNSDSFDGSDEPLIDADGTAWTVDVGCGAEQQRQIYESRMSKLQEGFDQVKTLYQNKHGRVLEDFEDDDETIFDKDGTAWKIAVGRGIEVQSQEYHHKVSELERQLEDVTKLYGQKYGPDLEKYDRSQEFLYDTDGTAWTVTVGRGTDNQRAAYEKKMSTLCDKLEVVKSLCSPDLEHYEDNGEHLYDSDGTAWTVTVGRGADVQKRTYADKLAVLEKKLQEVQALCGDCGADALASTYDADGTAWIVTVGNGSVEQRRVYETNLNRLQDELDEVKELYYQKHGRELDDYEDEEENLYDADGTAWRVTVGRGVEEHRSSYHDRIDRLEVLLESVKAQQEETCGKDLAVYEDDHEHLYDADGTAWTVTVGRGADEQKRVYDQNLSSLEGKLDEVKRVYEDKYGNDLQYYEDNQEHLYDADGVAWIVSVGRGLEEQNHKYQQKVSNLEDKLQEVKELYGKKFGADIDEHDIFHDRDGTAWTVSVGCGIEEQRRIYDEKVSSLMAKLEDVKDVYDGVHGKCLEDFEDDQEKLFDADGTAWTVTIGRGIDDQRKTYDEKISNFSVKLQEIRELHEKRHGRDLEDYDDDQELLYDADGTAWTVTVGRGAEDQRQTYAEKVSSLEEYLDEVKTLFAETHGKELEDYEDNAEQLYDADGTPWNVTVGRGVESQRFAYDKKMDALLDKLEEVKALVEPDAVKEHLYDADGTAWIVTVGRGVETQRSVYNEKVDALLKKLGEVKALSHSKLGRELEDFDDAAENLYDADGTAWRVTVGRGVGAQRVAYDDRLDALLSKLDEVKTLSDVKTGRGLEDYEDAQENLFDADGTAWTVTVGRGFAEQSENYQNKISSLAEKLDEVKSLYVERHGRELEDYEDDQEEMYDSEGARWTVSVGRGIQEQKDAYEKKVQTLLEKLGEVKEMHQQKHGRDLEDYEDDGAHLFDLDGTAWSVTVGRGVQEQADAYNQNVAVLDEKLDEVKALYVQKHGRELEDYEDDGDRLYDADGLAWQVSVGRGVEEQKHAYDEKISALEKKLESVKGLFDDKYGRDLEDYEDEHEHLYDADGTAWNVSVGRGIEEQRRTYFSSAPSVEDSAKGSKSSDSWMRLGTDSSEVSEFDHEAMDYPAGDQGQRGIIGGFFAGVRSAFGSLRLW